MSLSPLSELALGRLLGADARAEGSSAEMGHALAQLREVDAALRELLAALSAHPRLLEQARPLLQQLETERRARTELVGQHVLAWRLAGGTISLRAPGEASSARELARAAPGPSGREERKGGALDDAGRGMLATFLEMAGPPRTLEGQRDIAEEVDALEALVDTMERWPSFPKGIQRQLMAALVARARAVKERVGFRQESRHRVNAVRARCPVFAQAHPLGVHVNGLQNAHAPAGGAWREDALRLWGALVDAARRQQ